VEIEASLDEIEPIRKGALSLVTVKLYQGDGSEPETVTMEIEEFNNLAGGVDMEDVIRRAGPAYPPRKQARSAPLSAVDKLDYSTLEHAGKPHRGKTTDAEKEPYGVISRLSHTNEPHVQQETIMETSSPAQDLDGLPAQWTYTADTSPQRSSRPRPQRYHRPMGHESGRGPGVALRVRRLPAVAAGAGVVSVSVCRSPRTLSCLGILASTRVVRISLFRVVSEHTLMVE
jgi:hypothetical protein